MTPRDFRNSPVTGASPRALESFERALASFQCWRADTPAHVEAALDEAPAFVMAYALRCWLALCSREPTGASAALPFHARAVALPSNEREQLHLAAVGAAIADDYERCRTILATLLDRDPHDVLALQVAHAFDYLAGETTVMHERVVRAAAHWSHGMPGHHAVLAMLAFAQEENGVYDRAEENALRALALEPFDARAHHALAHVYEMTGRPDAGVRLMGERVPYWAAGTTVATHCWWHLALFHLEQGRVSHVLGLYDRRVRNIASTAVSDLIDASALLWRLALRGVDLGDRWKELAARWAPHASDGFCTFSDLHAMLAFVGAGNLHLAQQMIHELQRMQSLDTRHGRMTRRVGLPACRALADFGRGDYTAAIEGLGRLPAVANRIGGSHAQRDVIHLTLLEAIERVRGRRRPLRHAA